MALKLETIPIDKIQLAKYNPRKDLQPSDPEYKKLKKSMAEFDLVEPLIMNKRGNILIGGHQRLKILKEMGRIDVEVSVVDLPPTKEKALNLALNKIQGEWDFPKLVGLLQEIDTGDFDIEITGFDDKEIEDLMTKYLEPLAGLTDDDAVPDVPDPICKVGDLWKLGNHRLLCGDATVEAHVAKLMAGEKADMVFTDPPYGIEYQSNMRVKTPKFSTLQNDDVILTSWIPIVKMMSDGWILFFTNWKTIEQWLIAGQQFGSLNNLIIWDKGGGGIGDLKHSLSTDYEMILVYGRGNEIVGKRIGSVWAIGKDSAGTYKHPTQKPVELAITALKTFSTGAVLDLFGGSGSTLIACEKLNRKCYMMEIDEHYCDVIITRWENFTGRKAELIKD